MLSGLRFEPRAPRPAAAPERTDVACFVGFVARRHGTPLPAEVRTALRAAGWLDGPWRRDPPAIEALDHLPVAVESFDEFAALFAWEDRAVRAGGASRCATYLGAALRSFFASGGRRAIVIRAGDPFPFLEAPGGRLLNRSARIHALVPAYADLGLPAVPFAPGEPQTWRGIEHLYGLPEVSHLCLPDLPDICAADAPAPPTAFAPPPPPEVFVECSADEPPLAADDGLRRIAAPRSDDLGFIAWRAAVRLARDFLAARRRDALLVAALPLASAEARHDDGRARTHAQADFAGFLRGVGVLEGDGTPLEETAASAFVQAPWPWLRTTRSDDLPELLEPADGLFAGLLARNALARGTFRSVGGTLLEDVLGLTPVPATGRGPDGPTERLAERLCVIAPEPEGRTVVSDVTTAADPAWRCGGTSRLLGAILRAARRFGETHAFDPNGPALWAALRRSMEGMLAAFWREGAFGGRNANEAYSVRCDRSTMTQNDLDNGRLVAEISVLPAAAIARITVVLDMTLGAAPRAGLRAVA